MAVSEVLFLFVLGTVFGSFGNVLIARLPRGESVVRPGSRCPACRTPIKPYRNIPLLSWLLLRGKCPDCGVPIGVQYPLVELFSGLLFVAVFWKAGIGIFGLMAAVSLFLLLVLSAIDLRYKAVPDGVNLPAFLAALFASPFWLQSLESALLLAGGLAMLRFLVSWVFGKEAMGEADIIVGATMGALLGLGGGMAAIFLGSLLSLPVALAARLRGRDPEIPFIPFLAAGTLAVYLFGEWIPLFGALR